MEFCFSFAVQPSAALAETITYNFRKDAKFSRGDIIECAKCARRLFFEKTKEYPSDLKCSLSGETADLSVYDNVTFMHYFFNKDPIDDFKWFNTLWS